MSFAEASGEDQDLFHIFNLALSLAPALRNWQTDCVLGPAGLVGRDAVDNCVYSTDGFADDLRSVGYLWPTK
jgi:hypothetical protein